MRRLTLFLMLPPWTLFLLAAAAPAEGSGFRVLFVQALPLLLGWLFGAMTLFGGWVWIRRKMTQWTDALAEKTGIPYFALLDDLIAGAAGGIWDSTGKWLKRASADGELTEAEGKSLLADLKRKAMRLVNPSKLADLGVTDTAAYIESRLSPAIQASKLNGAATKAALERAKNPMLRVPPPDPTEG